MAQLRDASYSANSEPSANSTTDTTNAQK